MKSKDQSDAIRPAKAQEFFAGLWREYRTLYLLKKKGIPYQAIGKNAHLKSF